MLNQVNNSKLNLNPFSKKVGRTIILGFFSISFLILLISSISVIYFLKINKSTIDITGMAISEQEKEELSKIRNQINSASIMVFISGMVFFIVSISLGIYISKSISRPIKKLRDAAQELEKGNFKVRLDLNGLQEFKQLSRSFNKTAKTLGEIDEEHKQLEKAKTEFLSITSHELRSPMTPMKAHLEMLSQGYFGNLTKKQKDSIEVVLRNTVRLDRIIVDFLEISRIEAARLKFNFVKTDLTKHIQILIKEMEGFLPEKKIKIKTKIEKLPSFAADPDRIMQVLRNLLNNAKKFSPKNSEVIVSAKPIGEFIEISVKDSGIGISEKNQRRMFEPFFQAEQTMYRKYGGTGLGLTISRGIVEAQKGTINLKSKEGVGSIFTFTVPLKPVKKIEPIRLLFSPQEDLERKVSSLLIEILGPIGKSEFKDLIKGKELTKTSVLNYVKFLFEKGVIDSEKNNQFNLKINEIFGGAA